MKSTKGGLSIVGILILGVLIIFGLSYFNVDLKAVVESPQTKSNMNYVEGGIKDFWNNNLKEPMAKAWQFGVNSVKKIPIIKEINWDFGSLAPSAMPPSDNSNQ